VSNKVFKIVECNDCKFKFTNPRPAADELAAYYKSENYISHSNTSKGFINYLYQLVRKYTAKRKLKLIQNITKQGTILDIGCGTGEFLNQCQLNNYTCIGIEPNEDARNLAIENYNLDVRTENSIATLKNNSIDIITMWHVLEHISDLDDRINELKQLLKPNGTLIIAVPNCNSLDATIYKQYWAAFDVPRHLYHFTPKDIATLFNKVNMNIKQILPMPFDAFYVALLSEKYKHNKTKPFTAFYNGVVSNLSSIKNKNTSSSQIYILQLSNH